MSGCSNPKGVGFVRNRFLEVDCPRGVDNLLCAGRCLGTGDTIDMFRLICPCFVSGEAAGTAAALAALKGVTPRALDRELLRRTLADHGAYLG